ncbi:MAG: hypothetical protein ABJE63_15985 [Lentilitoribacter sp.]
MSKVFEVVSYELNSDATVEQAVEANKQSFEFIKSQPGFIKRSVVADDKGQWMDIVEWDNMEAVKAATAKFLADERNHALLAVIEQKTLKMQHLDVMAAS